MPPILASVARIIKFEAKFDDECQPDDNFEPRELDRLKSIQHPQVVSDQQRQTRNNEANHDEFLDTDEPSQFAALVASMHVDSIASMTSLTVREILRPRKNRPDGRYFRGGPSYTFFETPKYQ